MPEDHLLSAPHRVLHKTVQVQHCRYTVCRTLAFDVAATALLGVSWDSKTLGVPDAWHASLPAMHHMLPAQLALLINTVIWQVYACCIVALGMLTVQHASDVSSLGVRVS